MTCLSLASIFQIFSAVFSVAFSGQRGSEAGSASPPTSETAVMRCKTSSHGDGWMQMRTIYSIQWPYRNLSYPLTFVEGFASKFKELPSWRGHHTLAHTPWSAVRGARRERRCIFGRVLQSCRSPSSEKRMEAALKGSRIGFSIAQGYSSFFRSKRKRLTAHLRDAQFDASSPRPE